MSQMAVDTKAVETLLINEESVDDCAVRLREVTGKGNELVAYVVSRGEFAPERLQGFLDGQLSRGAVPTSYVSLSALPVDDAGQIDEHALESFAVIDNDIAERWEEELNALPEIEHAAVVVDEQQHAPAFLHLSDLLGEGEIFSETVAPVLERVEQQTAASASDVGKPAFSSGPSLSRELPATMAQALKAAAALEPARGIIYLEPNDQATSQSYAELLEEAECILGGFRRAGLKPGDKVIFQLEHNRDFVPAFWACGLGGFVPVPISIAPSYKELNATVTKLYHTWQMLDHATILTSKTLAPLVAGLPDLLQSDSFAIVTIEDLRSATPDKQWHDGNPDDLALMLLTSGSTGLPKGVMLTNRNILSRSAGVAQLDGFSENEVVFNWFPLDHVGGIVMYHTLAVYLRAQQLLAPTDMILQEPLKWLDVVDKYRITDTWAPNFAFGLVNDNEAELRTRKWDLTSLRFILNGGEAIVAKTSRRFLELLTTHGLPMTAMHPAWGMSETSSGITSSHRFQRDTTSDDMSFVEVGAPIPGISLRIVDSEDNLLQEDKIGRLQVQGSTITKGYYKNEELNRETFSKDGWFNTGDLGFLHDGCLTITGRTKDVIIINGINFYSHEIEGVVEEVKGVNVSFTAATAVREQGIDTDKLAIFFSPVESAKPADVSAEIRSHVLNRVGVNPDYLIPVEKDVIPKTAIGKIQRQQLRDRFEGGEFKQHLKQLDIESANARTVPDWFFRKCWSRREEVVRNSDLLKGSYLVFADDLGLAETLGRKLQEIGSPCVFVAPGPDFVKLDANHYRVNPGVSDHFRKLLASLSEDGAAVNNILHFWHYRKTDGAIQTQRDIEEAQRDGVYSLLHLVQAVAASQDSENGLRLFVVANHTQPVTPTDTITPEKATVLGFLKTLPLELSWLRPRHIDLELDEVEANAQRVWQELTIPKTRLEVAYRQGHRLVAALRKVNLLGQDRKPNAIKQNGVYLITGGLGGVGAELARFLSKRYQAKLILIGKTPLPPREEWTQHYNLKTELARRIKSLVEIEAAGGQVCYKVVDVCDLEGLRQAVAKAEEFWGEQIAGVFHLAGGLGGERNLEQHWPAMDSHRVVTEDVENFQRAFLPKVFGTLALRELIKDRPDTLFVLFSSVNSLFGGATFSAYSAANSFLDCYALHLSQTSHPRTYCFNWTMWDDIGMSRSNPEFAREATRNMGFFIMSKEQALNSLVAGLLRSEPQLVVGVDGHSRNTSRELAVKSEARQKLHAYFTARAGALASDHFAGLAVLDRFGKPSACAFQEVSELIVDQNGRIDREQLKDTERNQQVGTRELVGPRTDLEREIANIWRDVLRVPQISIHDNFFQIGGQSLLATQVISRLRKALEINLPLSALFEAPTIAGLSVSIGQTRQAIQPKGSRITALPRDKYRVSSGEVAN